MVAAEKWTALKGIREVEPTRPADGFFMDERKRGIKDDRFVAYSAGWMVMPCTETVEEMEEETWG